MVYCFQVVILLLAYFCVACPMEKEFPDLQRALQESMKAENSRWLSSSMDALRRSVGEFKRKAQEIATQADSIMAIDIQTEDLYQAIKQSLIPELRTSIAKVQQQALELLLYLESIQNMEGAGILNQEIQTIRQTIQELQRRLSEQEHGVSDTVEAKWMSCRDLSGRMPPPHTSPNNRQEDKNREEFTIEEVFDCLSEEINNEMDRGAEQSVNGTNHTFFEQESLVERLKRYYSTQPIERTPQQRPMTIQVAAQTEPSVVQLAPLAQPSITKEEANKYLIEGVKSNDVTKIREALNAGAEINVRDEYGEPLLHWAARNGYVEVAGLLINAGANIKITNSQGQEVLHSAAFYGSIEIIRMLIAKGVYVDSKDSAGNTPLYFAVESSCPGALGVVRSLIEEFNADITACNNAGISIFRTLAAQRGSSAFYSLVREAVFQYYRQRLNNQLLQTTHSRDIESIRRLLNAGADVNAQGGFLETPLHIAYYFGYQEIIEYLSRQEGINMNARDRNNNTPYDFQPWAPYVAPIQPSNVPIQITQPPVTAPAPRVYNTLATQQLLDFAQRSPYEGQEQDVQRAVDAGADVNAVVHSKEGWTPLHFAAHAGLTGVVRILLRAGAAVNARNVHGGIPLHRAAEQGHTEIVNVLLDAGTDIDTRTTELGNSSLHKAAQAGRLDVVLIFIARGATLNIENHAGQTPGSVAKTKEIAQLLGFVRQATPRPPQVQQAPVNNQRRCIPCRRCGRG